MRFAHIGSKTDIRPVVSGSDGIWRELTPVTAAITPGFLEERPDFELAKLPPVETLERFGPPIQSIGKIVCIGLNYRDHAAESGAVSPSEPIVLLKAPDTVAGPDDQVIVPRSSVKTDYEVELAVVIGRQARYLHSPDDSAACIAGYATSNDISEREFQLERGGQWDKGKNCETFNPLGPWLCTADDVADPQSLTMRLWVNGVLRQDGNTKNMIFDVKYLVWYLSQFMVLRPGDVINTGTPAGVAMGQPDQPYLRPGDVVEVEIDGLGRQRQILIAAQ